MRVLVFLLTLGSMALAQVPLPAAGKFPSIRVQVTVGTQERALGDFYHKTMHIQPHAVIDGDNTMLPIPAAEAQMMIISSDTKAHYTYHKDAYKVLSTQTLPVPAAQDGNRRQFNFETSDVTFDGYRDNSNAGGQMYKYYVFALRDAESKEILDFETNDLELLNYTKTHPEKRNEVLSMAKGAKFPTEFKAP